jgi:hypothetical protein
MATALLGQGRRVSLGRVFKSKTEALAHYATSSSRAYPASPDAAPELTLAELVELYLERHGRFDLSSHARHENDRLPPGGPALSSRTRRARPATAAARDAAPIPAPEGGPLNLNNFRRGELGPAVEASGIATPALIYDLRSTFASNALAAG